MSIGNIDGKIRLYRVLLGVGIADILKPHLPQLLIGIY